MQINSSLHSNNVPTIDIHRCSNVTTTKTLSFNEMIRGEQNLKEKFSLLPVSIKARKRCRNKTLRTTKNSLAVGLSIQGMQSPDHRGTFDSLHKNQVYNETDIEAIKTINSIISPLQESEEEIQRPTMVAYR